MFVFRAHCDRSILAAAANGVIEGNRIAGCTYDAITPSPFIDAQGGFTRNRVIRRNIIRRTGLLPWSQAAIRVSVGDTHEPEFSCRENQNLVIADNVIEDMGGDGIRVMNAQAVAIQGKTIAGAGVRRVTSRLPVAVRILAASHVTVAGNVILGSPADSARILTDPSLGNRVIQGNRIEPLNEPAACPAPWHGRSRGGTRWTRLHD